MGIKTKIPWCDSTLNLTMGCSQPCEIGDCCFAQRLCQRFAGHAGWPRDFSKPELFLERLGELRRWPDLTGTKRLDKPWLNGLPRLVFLSDLGEMFDPTFPRTWLGEHVPGGSVLDRLVAVPHVLIILTKQAKRMAEFFEQFHCPPNLWLGVSVTSPDTTWRVDELRKIETKVRIISHEPAIDGSIKWDLRGISQLISGGCSGPGAPPCDLAWLRSDRDQAKAAGVAWFMKQAGNAAYDSQRDPGCVTAGVPGWYYHLKHPVGTDPAEWPTDLQNCREVPPFTRSDHDAA